jgi:hypothetical protein
MAISANSSAVGSTLIAQSARKYRRSLMTRPQGDDLQRRADALRVVFGDAGDQRVGVAEVKHHGGVHLRINECFGRQLAGHSLALPQPVELFGVERQLAGRRGIDHLGVVQVEM